MASPSFFRWVFFTGSIYGSYIRTHHRRGNFLEAFGKVFYHEHFDICRRGKTLMTPVNRLKRFEEMKRSSPLVAQYDSMAYLLVHPLKQEMMDAVFEASKDHKMGAYTPDELVSAMERFVEGFKKSTDFYAGDLKVLTPTDKKALEHDIAELEGPVRAALTLLKEAYGDLRHEPEQEFLKGTDAYAQKSRRMAAAYYLGSVNDGLDMLMTLAQDRQRAGSLLGVGGKKAILENGKFDTTKIQGGTYLVGINGLLMSNFPQDIVRAVTKGQGALDAAFGDIRQAIADLESGSRAFDEVSDIIRERYDAVVRRALDEISAKDPATVTDVQLYACIMRTSFEDFLEIQGKSRGSNDIDH
jgi:hypothetical protein